MKSIFLVLNDIRSMENVGSIFRTADAAGITKIYLCGITPRPPRKEIDKAAVGAVDFVDWEYVENIKTLISNFKKNNVPVIALEQSAVSIPYTLYEIPASPAGGPDTTDTCALILGNEVDGISNEILDICDTIVEIPMHGQKNSLNVSVAAGIALFQLIK